MLMGLDMPGKKNTRLRTIGDVCRLLAKTINELRRGEIEESKAGKIGYLCNILIGGLKDSSLEERVEKLEQILAEEKEKP
jgi:hypothetical protein